MRILIRAEGGSTIGMGHVMRMVVLAGKLKSFAEVVFICRDNEEFQTGIKYIEAAGYKVLKIDSLCLFAELKAIEGDCLITDSYEVDEEYFNTVRSMFDMTGYMDDLNKHRINADFIINQNIYADDLVYKTDSSTKLLLGTRYALLRDEFAGLPGKNIKNKIKDILITFGAADSGNLSEKTVRLLCNAYPELSFHIAVGPAFTHVESLQGLGKKNVSLYHNPKLSELIGKCDVAVSACGGTIYELCACGMPAIGVVAADNQAMTAEKLSSMGIIKLAFYLDEIAVCLEKLDYETRTRMSIAGQQLIDGHGSIRLAEEIGKILTDKVMRGD